MEKLSIPLSLGDWLKSSRVPYLNFLRNLTPQILLLSVAWRLASKLNFDEIDISNWVPTFGFYLFVVLAFYSAYASSSLFLAEAFPGFKGWIESQVDNIRNLKPGKRPLAFIKTILKERALEAFLAVFAIVMLEFVFSAILAFSLMQAFE